MKVVQGFLLRFPVRVRMYKGVYNESMRKGSILGLEGFPGVL